ncbi:hypothetical protein ACFQU2_30620 [Siccirubricoccus deserti]
MATIVSQDPMRVAFTVSARAGVELRNRYESRGGVNAVRIRIRLTDGRVYGQSGQIDFIDTQIDRNTDSLLIRALMPNPRRDGVQAGAGDRELIDGQFVTVSVEGWSRCRPSCCRAPRCCRTRAATTCWWWRRRTRRSAARCGSARR